MYDNTTHKLLHKKADSVIVRNEAEAKIAQKIAQASSGEAIEIPNEMSRRLADAFESWYPDNEESDPNGLDQHSPGAKADAGKIRMSLVLDGFKRALTEVGKVGTFGANKYSDNGWMEVENGIVRYRDALYRHLLATDYYDSESGLPHMAHAAWNMLALLELMERENGTKS